MTENTIMRYAKMLYALEYKGRYCKQCGFDGFLKPWLMDLHHRDPTEKEFLVKNKIYSSIFYTIKPELDKCDLLCCYCHRDIHSIGEEYNKNYEKVLSRLDTLKTAGGNASNRRPFTEDEKNYILSNVTVLSRQEIADNLKRGYDSVSRFIRDKTSEKYLNKPIRSNLPTQTIIKLYVENKNSLRFIANKYDTSSDTIKKLLTDNNISIRTKEFLDKKKVIELINEGFSDADIAKQLNYTYKSIWSIRNRLRSP